MPKRTNTFQELVTLIQQSLAQTGSIVTQSAELIVGGQLREIDVLVTVDVGLARIKIAVEAKDHKRKLDVTQIESLIGKYRNPDGLPVNQVILVARRGFTASAIARAKQVNMRLFTLDEAASTDWPKTLQFPRKQKIRFHISPYVAGVEVRPVMDKQFCSKIAGACVVCSSCGRQCGSLQHFSRHLIEKHLSKSQKQLIAKQFNDACQMGQKGILCNKVTFEMKKKSLQIEEERFALDAIVVHLHAKHEEGELNFSYYDYVSADGESHQVHHGKARFHDSTVEVLMPDGTSSKNITIRIGDSC